MLITSEAAEDVLVEELGEVKREIVAPALVCFDVHSCHTYNHSSSEMILYMASLKIQNWCLHVS